MSIRVAVCLCLLSIASCSTAPRPVPSAPVATPAPTPAPTAEPEPVPPAPPTVVEAPVPDYPAWLEYFDTATGKRQIFPIQGGKVIRVGRGSPDQANPDIDLAHVVDGQSVSRRHAEIMQRDGAWMLFIQPDTTNRSFLNQEIIDRGSLNPLKEGDEIQLGGVTLLFRVRGEKP